MVVLWFVISYSPVNGYQHFGDTATLTLRDDAVGGGSRFILNVVLHVQDCVGPGRCLKNTTFVKIMIL
jgi:hypothetical protein